MLLVDIATVLVNFLLSQREHFQESQPLRAHTVSESSEPDSNFDLEMQREMDNLRSPAPIIGSS